MNASASCVSFVKFIDDHTAMFYTKIYWSIVLEKKVKLANMALGMCLFELLNYLGRRPLAFRETVRTREGQ